MDFTVRDLANRLAFLQPINEFLNQNTSKKPIPRLTSSAVGSPISSRRLLTCCMTLMSPLLLLILILPLELHAAGPQRSLRIDHRTPAETVSPPQLNPLNGATNFRPTTDHESHNYETSTDSDSKESAASEYNPIQPPQDLGVVRLNDTSVVLKWDIAYGAHEHLQFFKIQYKPTKQNAEWKTDNREIPPTTKAYQINGLRPGNYFFIVNAVYDNDDNVSSEQIKYRLRAKNKIKDEEMPEQKAPVIYWSHAEFDFFRFKWTYKPKDKDVPDNAYLVYYRSTHAVTDFTIYSTLDENVEIAEVEPETPYEAKVVAYNLHGVSEFSDLIRIKTLPKSTNSTSNTPVSSTILPQPNAAQDALGTTIAPFAHTTSSTLPPTTSTTITSLGFNETNRDITNILKYNTSRTADLPQSTIKPHVPTHPGNNTLSSVHSTFHSLSSVIDLIFGAQTNDITLAIRYSLLILLPLICIVSATLCLISCRQRSKHSPPSSAHVSMQFDLEINSYFKNSFPGVEKEYPTLDAHSHSGFVNNHPHINDFT